MTQNRAAAASSRPWTDAEFHGVLLATAAGLAIGVALTAGLAWSLARLPLLLMAGG